MMSGQMLKRYNYRSPVLNVQFNVCSFIHTMINAGQRWSWVVVWKWDRDCLLSHTAQAQRCQC